MGYLSSDFPVCAFLEKANKMAITVNWSGKSGTSYAFELYKLGQEFNPVSGVYVFCRETSPGSWQALYVGETQSLHDRLNTGIANHDGFKCASRNGATHIAVRVVSGEANRLRVETDLRHGINPVCNKQSVKSAADILYGR